VQVGNTTTRHIVTPKGEWVYTPRGYHRKLGVQNSDTEAQPS
jgi:precorrin-3B methylase